MRNYQIYLIEDEFAAHYYGREKLFFNLFFEYMHANGELKDILRKQINYVTKPLPSIRLSEALLKSMGSQTKEGMFFTKSKAGDGKAALAIRKDHLLLKADGDYEAETAFFECIRKCGGGYLALDFQNQKYGWLKPIKERKFV